jgi:predicted AAA+ superfamily ATPase
MIFKRAITQLLIKAVKQYPIVGIMGPRQSGKTTIVRQSFPNYTYVTMENLDTRAEALEDPRKFFATYNSAEGLIIDEIQEVPALFSYLQGIVDESPRKGFYIITGSQNFLLHEKITQTLAGRIALLTLLPLTIEELHAAAEYEKLGLEEILFTGLYPRIYAEKMDIEWWFSNYIATYVERDVRQIIKVGDVNAFRKFLTLCAARTGSLLNYADLARDADISPNTAKAWISILEASYIITLLQPYHENFNKRIVKSPKLYFYDTGLVCALLGIHKAQDLFVHPIRGNLFETLIISELHKLFFNAGKRPPLYFWRDVQGHEIDCLIERSYKEIIPIEIKSGMTMQSDFFKNIVHWQEITGQNLPPYVIYAGNQKLLKTNGIALPWNAIQKILEK